MMKKHRILIAEDESMTAELLKFTFEHEHFDVIVVDNGKDALEEINKELPSVIISDIMMPFVSGFELLRHVRMTLSQRIPFILLSSVVQEATIIKSFELGADEFVRKPFGPEELITRVKLSMLRTRNQLK